MAQTLNPSSKTLEKTGEEADFETLSPAAHVGRTLEAEGIFDDVLGDALPTGEDSPDRLRRDQTGIDQLGIRTFEENHKYQKAVRREDAQREATGGDAMDRVVPVNNLEDAAGTPLAEASEPLITRLPGDTSSDPHTDLGPDNATTAHATIEK